MEMVWVASGFPLASTLFFYAVYTEPQVGRVGMTLEQAQSGTTKVFSTMTNHEQSQNFGNNLVTEA
jgi:pyruvate/2-oxoglutarate dehydrogenase complex dihydrolipoamide dehydrogenase (E3) component